ncbi:hypothetical protein PCANC_00947 [Puccinia coronata f. sp. avenae]|uniref:Uncharacterized protein n=1 Tax=Puccinia coronata f. sp. avenae TaxID=200324 RepID=A0A2N5W6H7_9BASI|nr:hypothetical protein PCANC_00947 [Puccinia coronata f. sp. avenae]
MVSLSKMSVFCVVLHFWGASRQVLSSYNEYAKERAIEWIRVDKPKQSKRRWNFFKNMKKIGWLGKKPRGELYCDEHGQTGISRHAVGDFRAEKQEAYQGCKSCQFSERMNELKRHEEEHEPEVRVERSARVWRELYKVFEYHRGEMPVEVLLVLVKKWQALTTRLMQMAAAEELYSNDAIYKLNFLEIMFFLRDSISQRLAETPDARYFQIDPKTSPQIIKFYTALKIFSMGENFLSNANTVIPRLEFIRELA